MKLTLRDKEHLVDNIWAFRFTPEEVLNYTAGQYVRVELPHDNPDDEGTKRWFTNSAAPYEGIMQITTRVTDSTFKQALGKLEPGGTLDLIESPDGDFVWQDCEFPMVFVAGGIGVTPYYSILKQRVHDGQPLAAELIYVSRTLDVAFRKEFDEWASTHPEFTVQYCAGTPLTAESLTKLVPKINESMVYVSGPEPMVESVGDDLKAHGLPEAQLKQDYFPHYDESNY